MSKPKAWDGVLFILVCPVRGGGWVRYEGAYQTREIAERFRMTEADRVVRLKVRLPKERP